VCSGHPNWVGYTGLVIPNLSMKKNAAALFVLALSFVLVGAGCAPEEKTPAAESNVQAETEAEVEVTDDAGDTVGTSTLNGVMTVNACDLDKDFCADITVDVYYDTIISADWDGIDLAPSESYCDDESCYLVDYEGDTWFWYY